MTTRVKVNTPPPIRINIKLAAIRKRGPLYSSSVEGYEVSGRPSLTPFCSTARELMNQGLPANTRITMYHEGSDVMSLSGFLGPVSQLTVSEHANNGIQFERWRGFDSGFIDDDKD